MNKFIFHKVVVAFLFVVLFFSQAFGAGIVLKIDKNGLDGWSATLDPNYNGNNAEAANIEFFAGSIPAPNAVTGKFSPNYTFLAQAQVHQYDNTVINGGNVYLRSWDGTPRQKGSYYGKSAAYPAASGAQPALQYSVVKFKTDFLADIPKNAPVFGAVSESNVRVGDTTDVVLNLSITYSYSMGSPKIEITGYKLKYWLDSEAEPADDDKDRVVSTGGGSFSLPSEDPKTSKPFGSGTYHFKVRATNWFGDGPWSAKKDWTTLSGGVAGAFSFTRTLYEFSGDKLVVNMIAPPKATTAKALVEAIEAIAGKDSVIAVSHSLPEESKSEVYAPLTGAGEDFPIGAGEGVQVFLKKTVEIKLE